MSFFTCSVKYNAECVASDQLMAIPGDPLKEELSIRYTYAVRWEVSFYQFIGL